MHVSLWLWLGLSEDGLTTLIGSLINQNRKIHNGDPLVGSAVATSGSLGSRVIEAKLEWSVLNSAIDSWFQPAGGVAAAVQAGYMFGCDPRLLDQENTTASYTPTRAMGWLSGVDDPVGWPQGYYRWPTGRDTFSTDIRLVCSAGDLDFDCSVNYVDFAQFARGWLDTGCNNVNDFCNGADIVINGDVGIEDLAKFALRWLLP